MINPFFTNNGPFNIIDILKTINLDTDGIIDNQNIFDIKDLFTSEKNENTFFSFVKHEF